MRQDDCKKVLERLIYLFTHMTPTPETIQQLIEKLGGTTIIKRLAGGIQTAQVLPVLLGDVLERIRVTTGELNSYRETTLLWEPCGFNKPLQEIFDSAEWEEGSVRICTMGGGTSVSSRKQLKDPNIRNLAEYLCSLFLKTEEEKVGKHPDGNYSYLCGSEHCRCTQ